MAKKAAQADSRISLTILKEAEILINIRGVTPVIPHAWSQKALRMMPGHPEKPTVKQAKTVRDPDAEAEGCLYRLEDGDLGLPAVAFKSAAVGACRLFEGLTIVQTKVLLFVVGEGLQNLVRIQGNPTIREDTPRNSNGGTDLRYRYQINDWSAQLRVRYVPAIITPESVVALVDAGGRGGVGDWRPSAPKSHTGIYGQFRVVMGE